jgi:hypothetical protein
MQDAYPFSQLAATVFLIVFSVGLGYLKLRFFGFGFRGLLDRQVSYEERRRTPIGKKAHRPLLIRHAESPFYIFGLSILPTILNGALLIALAWSGQYALAPAIAIPLALVELALAWWVQKQRVPMYESDFADYLRLTEPGNCWFVGEVKDRDYSAVAARATDHLLSGGKIVSAFSQRRKGGPIECRRFFLPLTVLPVPGDGQVVRLFYRGADAVQGRAVDGIIIGFQPYARPKVIADPTYEDLEERIAAKY